MIEPSRSLSTRACIIRNLWHVLCKSNSIANCPMIVSNNWRLYNHKDLGEMIISTVHQLGSQILWFKYPMYTFCIWFIVMIRYLIVVCVSECDLYWSGEVGCGTSITLETGGDDWRGQTKHKVICIATFGDIKVHDMCNYAYLSYII